MEKTSNDQAIAPKPSTLSDCASQVLMLVIWLWVIAVSVGFISVEVFTFGTMPQLPHYILWITSLLQWILVFLPLLFPALFWKNIRYQAVFKTWLMAAVCGFLLLPAHFPQPYAAQTQAIIHALGFMVYLGLLTIIRYRQRHDGVLDQGRANIGIRVSLTLLFGAFYFYPWLAWGALGSLLDTVLQLIVAIFIGISTAVTVDIYFLSKLYETSRGQVLDFLLGGFTIGTTLLIIGSSTGFGYSVMQLLLMLSLPTLGWVIMGTIQLRKPEESRQNWLPEAILTSLAVFAPLSLIDADELALIISATSGEILGWAFHAAFVSLGIGFILSLLFLMVYLLNQFRKTHPSKDQTPPIHRRTMFGLGVVAGVAWIIGGLLYFMVGQPGFYGEGLFVILKDQADVSSARTMSDYATRRRHVYTTLVDQANSSQEKLRHVLDRWRIGYTPYYLENAIQVQGGPLLRLWLSSRPEVDRVLNNPWMRPLPVSPPVNKGSQSDRIEGVLWNQTLIGADRVWNELGVTGEGIIVGQSDSGVQWNHPELVSSYRGSHSSNGNPNDYNWYDPWYGTEQPVDVGGHGTHTLGIALGKHTGIAPGATWFACANLVRNLGNSALYLDCMQFMLAPFPIGGNPFTDGDPSKGAHVINNSWGCPDHEGCDINALLYGVQALSDAGIFVVASAGNDGPFCKTLNTPPPTYADAFAVGAIDQFGQLALFSSVGPVTADGSNRTKPDIVAPGVNVFSSMPENTYTFNTGTSMAGPHVVGVVALMWSANPALIGDIDQTWDMLIKTAKPYQGRLPNCPGVESYPSTATGYGILNAYEAVKMALQAGTGQ